MNKMFWALPLVLLLSACGGADPGPVPQARPPVISDPGAVSLQEFSTVATRVVVSSPDNLSTTLSLSGTDAAAFTIAADGTVSFKLPPDYTKPADANKDNVYLVTVTAADGYTLPSTRALSIAVTSCPACHVTTNVSIDGDGLNAANIVADFEDPVALLATGGWVATGAFVGPTAGSWQGTTVSAIAARVNNRAISTCEMNGGNCDGPTGTLTSPAFQVAKTTLNFLMHGGSGSNNVGLRILDTLGNVLHTYRPASCGPSFIQNDDDWTHINIAALSGAWVKAQLFDEESGGCGFVSTDQWYQSDAAWNPSGNGKDGGTVALTAGTAARLGFNVKVDADAFVQVIGDFDDAQATLATWTATGDFAGPGSADAWDNLKRPAKVGVRPVTTCEMNSNAKGCDAPTGTLTSPLVTVDAARPYLNFLMSGGSGSNNVGLAVLDAGGTVIATYKPGTCGRASIVDDADWVTIDLAAQAGQPVRVQIFDNESGGCGFVAFDQVYLGAVRKK